MDNTTRNKTNLVLYIVLALIIVAVVCMTIFSIATGTKRKTENAPVKVTDTAKSTEKKESAKTPDTYLETEAIPETKPTAATNTPSVDANAPAKLNVTKPISNGYLLKGYDIEMPVFSLTMNDYRVHAGIDILANPGDAVMSIAEGTVQNIYKDAMMGNCISVSHSGGLVSYYMGLSDEVCEGIEEGAPVYCGQNLSSVGDSTLIEIAEEPHLHFELKQNGKYVDPTSYFSYELSSSENAVDEAYEG